jgi:hypothetical protein
MLGISKVMYIFHTDDMITPNASGWEWEGGWEGEGGGGWDWLPGGTSYHERVETFSCTIPPSPGRGKELKVELITHDH